MKTDLKMLALSMIFSACASGGSADEVQNATNSEEQTQEKKSKPAVSPDGATRFHRIDSRGL